MYLRSDDTSKMDRRVCFKFKCDYSMGKKMVRIMHIRGKPSQAKRSVSAKELSLTHQNDIKAILAGVK